MTESGARDIFDTTRLASAAFLIVSGLAAIAGSVLDWVTITALPLVPEGSAAAREVAERGTPFTGLEADWGWASLVAGVVVLACGALLALRARSGYAILAMLASIVVGAVGIAAFRAIGDDDSPLMREMARIGEMSPGIGVVLVTLGGIVGLLAAVAGVVATPKAREADALSG